MAFHYAHHAAERKHHTSLAARTLFASLAAAGVAKVECQYYGSSDDGCVEAPTFYDAAGGAMPPPYGLGGLVEDFIYNALPGGWDNNDGSSGIVTLDVAAGLADFDHNYNETISTPAPFSIHVLEPG